MIDSEMLRRDAIISVDRQIDLDFRAQDTADTADSADLRGASHLHLPYFFLSERSINGALRPQIVKLISGQINHSLCDVHSTSYFLHISIGCHSSRNGQPNAWIFIGMGFHLTDITPTTLNIPAPVVYCYRSTV